MKFFAFCEEVWVVGFGNSPQLLLQQQSSFGAGTLFRQYDSLAKTLKARLAQPELAEEERPLLEEELRRITETAEQLYKKHSHKFKQRRAGKTPRRDAEKPKNVDAT